jgi:hypothetical protein
MAERDGSESSWSTFIGRMGLPGDKNTHGVSVSLSIEEQVVNVRFDSPVGGSSDWEGVDVQMARRLKFHEVVFKTRGLPADGLDLTWKMSVAHSNEMAAGVVIAQRGETGIKGENGFTLEGPASGKLGPDNYLTQLSSTSYTP